YSPHFCLHLLCTEAADHVKAYPEGRSREPHVLQSASETDDAQEISLRGRSSPARVIQHDKEKGARPDGPPDEWVLPSSLDFTVLRGRCPPGRREIVGQYSDLLLQQLLFGKR